MTSRGMNHPLHVYSSYD